MQMPCRRIAKAGCAALLSCQAAAEGEPGGGLGAVVLCCGAAVLRLQMTCRCPIQGEVLSSAAGLNETIARGLNRLRHENQRPFCRQEPMSAVMDGTQSNKRMSRMVSLQQAEETFVSFVWMDENFTGRVRADFRTEF